MKTPPPPLSINEALKILLLAASESVLSDQVHLPLAKANHQVLAEDIIAPINVPQAANAQMDGYAVNSASVSNNNLLFISQRIAAGHVPEPLQHGTAARIFTGALIPDGADAVVMQEQCEVVETTEGQAVRLLHIPCAGEWVRNSGSDIRKDNIILRAGTRLHAQHLGLAASVGLASLPLKRRLKVAIFFTGDELAMPGDTLPSGAIYNSNRFFTAALLKNLACDILDLGIVPDSLEATRSALRQAAQQCDVIISSGGVSVGEEDHVKAALQAEGRLNLWQIAMKPGKPLAFGEINSAFYFGLPGNPVSSFITFLILVRPFLLRLQGVIDVTPKSYLLRADFAWPPGEKIESRNEFLRVKLNAHGGLDLYSNQNSAVLSSMTWGDGLVDNPAGNRIQPDELVKFIPFSELI